MPKSPAELGTLRDAIHNVGANRYPTRWFNLNQRAAEAIQKCGGRIDDTLLRTLAPLIVLKVLQAVMPCERVPDEPTAQDIKRLIELKILKPQNNGE
jgi:hypothetical protein